MADKNSRRKFLKSALVAVGGATALFTNVKFDASDGVKIGRTNIRIGMSEASGKCGFAANCSGGGGKCGFAANCSGS